MHCKLSKGYGFPCIKNTASLYYYTTGRFGLKSTIFIQGKNTITYSTVWDSKFFKLKGLNISTNPLGGLNWCSMMPFIHKIHFCSLVHVAASHWSIVLSQTPRQCIKSNENIVILKYFPFGYGSSYVVVIFLSSELPGLAFKAILMSPILRKISAEKWIRGFFKKFYTY